MKTPKRPKPGTRPTKVSSISALPNPSPAVEVAAAISDCSQALVAQPTARRRPRRRLNADGRSVWPTPTVPLRKSTASPQLLHLMGHHPSCIALTGASQIYSCDCRINPVDDPAVTIGLAIHSARVCLSQKSPMPPVVVELLARRLAEGDPACRMVAEWLESCGLIQVRTVMKLADGGSDRS